MSDTRYAGVIEAFCKLIGFDDATALIQRGQLVLDEVVFTLNCDPLVAPETVTVYCDFGEPEPWLAAQAYRAVLGSNLFLYGSGESVFCALPSNGHVTLASRIPLAELQAEPLLVMLQEQAAAARNWRKHYFLTEAGLQGGFADLATPGFA